MVWICGGGSAVVTWRVRSNGRAGSDAREERDWLGLAGDICEVCWKMFVIGSVTWKSETRQASYLP